MLKSTFGVLEQFPILALNEFVKKNYTAQSVTFSDAGAATGGGFHCKASGAGVSCIGHGSSKKEAKQVAAQALIKTLQSAQQPEPPAFQMNPATTPAVEPAQVTMTVQSVQPAMAGKGPSLDNPVSKVTTGSQLFKQALNWDIDAQNINDHANKCFTCKVTFGELTASGVGQDKKSAKQNAGMAILPIIEATFGSIEAKSAEKRQARANANKRGRGGARGGRGG